MEQYSQKYQDDSSSSEEILIESNNDNNNNNNTQSEKQNPVMILDIREFIDVGEYLDYFVNHRQISVKVLEIQNPQIYIQLMERENSYQWVEYDFQILQKQWIPGVKFIEQQRIDVKNKHQGWMVGTVIEIKQQQIKIHYNGYKQCYDEYITVSSENIQPLGQKTGVYGMGWLLQRQPQLLNRSVSRFQQYLQIRSTYLLQRLYSKLEQQFPQIIMQRGLCIKEVAGDGNCMFRAISDQLYGTELYHRELRMFAIQYINLEREFFCNFVEEGNIDKYLEYKIKDGVWGDNIELQAFRELYGIPIEIYVYSTIPLKAGLDHNPNNIEPIRLSYHGRSHYNSLKPINNVNYGLLENRKCGEIENDTLKKLQYKEVHLEKTEHKDLSRSQSLIKQPNLLENVFNESRISFEKEMKQKEQEIFQQSLEQFNQEDDNQMLDMVIQQSAQEAEQQIQQQLQNDQIDNQILNNILKESELSQQQIINEYELKQAMEESIYKNPLQNPIIAQIVQQHYYFTIEQVLEAYAVCGGEPESIINYLYDHQFN